MTLTADKMPTESRVTVLYITSRPNIENGKAKTAIWHCNDEKTYRENFHLLALWALETENAEKPETPQTSQKQNTEKNS